MKTIKWIMINGIFASMLYFGLVKGVTGAKNVAFVWAWLGIFVSFLSVTDHMVNVMKNKKKSLPRVGAAFNLLVLLTLAWFGHIITAVFYLIHIILLASMWDRIGKLQEEENEKT